MNVFGMNLQPGIGHGDDLMGVLPDLGAGIACAQKPDGNAQMHQDLRHRIGPLDMGGCMMMEPTHAIALAAGAKPVCEVPGRIQMVIEPIEVFAQLFKSGRNDRPARVPEIIGGPEDTAALSGPRVVLHGLKTYVLHETFGPAFKSAFVMFRCGKTHQSLPGSGGWRDWVLSAWCVVKEHRLSHANDVPYACGAESLICKPISERRRGFVTILQGVLS